MVINMRKCRIGVVGIGRGSMMWNYCKDADNAELVAICDKWEQGLENVKKELGTGGISYYTDYDEFLKHDMDAVMLANYATEHAPFAIKAMEAGKSVISEVLPCQTMAEAVALIECVERTGKVYCYAENYCFMGAPHEIRKKYLEGALGTFEYGEGEYLHNCEPIWTDITYGERDHWRNSMSAFFYCTHSAGPLIHITGMRPARVTGFECPFNTRMARMGARAGHTAIEMVTFEDGSIFKSIHGVGPSKNSIWYTVYGSKGRMESAREDAGTGGVSHVYEYLDSAEGADDAELKNYFPEMDETAKHYGHGGSDFYCLHGAIERIMGDTGAEYIDLFEALDMWMCCHFGYLSVLDGGVPKEIPDLRKKSERDKYRDDRRCTDPKVGKEQTLPCYSAGNPDIPDEIYDARRREWKRANGISDD